MPGISLEPTGYWYVAREQVDPHRTMVFRDVKDWMSALAEDYSNTMRGKWTVYLTGFPVELYDEDAVMALLSQVTSVACANSWEVDLDDIAQRAGYRGR